MKITDVKVFPVEEEKLKAYATITFENCFIVRDLKVISGNKGYFIAMPSKKRKDGTFRDVAHPLNSETRKLIEDAVLEVYEQVAAQSAPAASYDESDAEISAPPELAAAEAEDTSEEAVDTAEAEAPDGEEPAEPALEEAAPEPAPAEEAVEETAAPEASAGYEPEEPAASEASEDEDIGKGAEENPVIEQSEDPEKAFGYEE
jgi:stage V sporulation protein G